MFRGPSIFCALVCITLSHSSFSQDYMYLDDAFKESSTQMQAKRKGISALGKYEFGTYKIISGKAGGTTTTSKSGIKTQGTNIQSKQKSSFEFTGEGMDTISASINFSSITQITETQSLLYQVLLNWSVKEMEGKEVHATSYTRSSDTTQWNLILVTDIQGEIRGDFASNNMASFKGTLMSSQTSIDVVPVWKWDNGKPSSVLRPLEAYTFVLEGETLAAVQVYPSNKLFVWIKQDLSEDMKFILAAGAATLLVRSY
jgi:hypothetical protein